jgi:hypothetical protein
MKQVWFILFCALTFGVHAQSTTQNPTKEKPPEQQITALIIYDDKGALVDCKNYDELTSAVTECSLVKGRTLDEAVTFFIKKYNMLQPAQPEDTNSKQLQRHTA